MTIDEMLARQSVPRKHHNDEEHRLQAACVRWFRAQYPSVGILLFAVPNGGRRDKVTGAKLKEEGVTSGVSDLIMLAPNSHHHALCIEMKVEQGRQSTSQREWQQAVTKQGYKYVVCRSLSDFMKVVKDYLKQKDYELDKK